MDRDGGRKPQPGRRDVRSSGVFLVVLKRHNTSCITSGIAQAAIPWLFPAQDPHLEHMGPTEEN